MIKNTVDIYFIVQCSMQLVTCVTLDKSVNLSELLFSSSVKWGIILESTLLSYEDYKKQFICSNL